MKFLQVFTTAIGVLVTTAFAQQGSTMDQSSSFNLSSINGTWHVAGLTDVLLYDFAELSQYFNFSIKCPQIYIAGNSTNVSYVQPSFNLEYYNESLGRNQTANFSLSGLMTLENVTSPTQANFSVLLALPQMNDSSSSSSSSSSTNSLAKILAVGGSSSSATTLNITAGNVTDPLPYGANLSATFSFNLSSSNGSVYDIVLLTASNFSVVSNSSDSSNGDSNSTQNYDYDDSTSYTNSNDNGSGNYSNMTDQVYQLLLTNTSTVLNQTVFNQTIQTYGEAASNITRLNNTCTSSTRSSSGGSRTSSSRSASRSNYATAI